VNEPQIPSDTRSSKHHSREPVLHSLLSRDVPDSLCSFDPDSVSSNDFFDFVESEKTKSEREKERKGKERKGQLEIRWGGTPILVSGGRDRGSRTHFPEN